MKKSTMETLRDALQTAAEALSIAIGSKPPRGMRVSTDLLEHAPTSLAELPEWFERLDDVQFRRVWVAALVLAYEEGEEGEDGAGLAKALIAARERYAVIIDRREGHPSGAMDGPALPSQPGSQPGSQRGSLAPQPTGHRGPTRNRREDVIARARAAAPRVGDTFEHRAVFPEMNSSTLRYFLGACEEFDVPPPHHGGGQRRRSSVVVTRIKDTHGVGGERRLHGEQGDGDGRADGGAGADGADDRVASGDGGGGRGIGGGHQASGGGAGQRETAGAAGAGGG